LNARDPSTIDAKRRDHFLQADFSLLILIATWSWSGLRSIRTKWAGTGIRRFKL